MFIVVNGIESDNEVDLRLIVIGCSTYSVAFLLAAGHLSVWAASVFGFVFFFFIFLSLYVARVCVMQCIVRDAVALLTVTLVLLPSMLRSEDDCTLELEFGNV